MLSLIIHDVWIKGFIFLFNDQYFGRVIAKQEEEEESFLLDQIIEPLIYLEAR